MTDLQSETHARQETALSRSEFVAAAPRGGKVRLGLRGNLIGVFGGSLTGVSMAFALGTVFAGPTAYDLQIIPVDEVETASQSLVASKSIELVREAKACRQPLAFLLVKGNGTATGWVRFRSGTYVSPNVMLGPSVERLALPLPAPYATGSGQIIVENASPGADIFLQPGFRQRSGAGTSTIRVLWNPKAPC